MIDLVINKDAVINKSKALLNLISSISDLNYGNNRKIILRILEASSETIELECEPGNATRYHLIITFMERFSLITWMNGVVGTSFKMMGDQDVMYLCDKTGFGKLDLIEILKISQLLALANVGDLHPIGED